MLDCLCARFPRIDRVQWLDRIQRRRVLLENDVAVTIDTRYREGLTVRYFREVAKEAVIPFEARVLHVDKHLVVADKPHFLPVMPSGKFVEQTLLRRLMRELENSDLVPLHRIDRLTAGLVLFSADRASRGAYQALFRERRIRKIYEAIAPPLADVALPHVASSRVVAGEPFFRMRVVPGESNSETRIDVIERGETLWRYQLEPVSGRKHQLRVQMAALGAPVLGDPLYPTLLDEAPDNYASPLRLLARSLEFVDPLTGNACLFTSERELDV